MNRVEQRKIKKENRIKRMKKIFIGILSFCILITLLYTGLEIVDETNRTMMWVGEADFLSYNWLDEKNIQVVFCGDRYLVNVEKVSKLSSYIKEKTKYGVMEIKKYASNTGKLVTKFIYNTLN